MKFALLLLGLATLYAVHGFRLDETTNEIFELETREPVTNTRALIRQLADNLRDAAQQGIDAVRLFGIGISDIFSQFRAKLFDQIGKIRSRITDAIKGVYDRITGATSAVKDCLESSRYDAKLLLDKATAETLECADKRIKSIGDLVNKQATYSKEAIEYSRDILDQMQNCTENNDSNLLSAGTCLTALSIRAEISALRYSARSTFGAVRINLGISTMPGQLELCAASQLGKVTVGAGRIIFEIGRCSVTSVFTNVFANTDSEDSGNSDNASENTNGQITPTNNKNSTVFKTPVLFV